MNRPLLHEEINSSSSKGEGRAFPDPEADPTSAGNYVLSNFLYNPFASQHQRLAQAALHRGPLSMMSDQHQRKDNLLAAAVHQQLFASLTSPSSIAPFLPLGRTANIGNTDLQVSHLSRSASSDPNSALMQGLNIPSCSLGSFQQQTPEGTLTLGQEQLDSRSRTRMGKQGSTIQIPCQARGMATDHNSMTAYFEIPSDAKHGQHLYCSHPVCRASGVKFRYCLYCRKPVTKQNFRSRHLHADLNKRKNDNDEATKKQPSSGNKRGGQEASGDESPKRFAKQNKRSDSSTGNKGTPISDDSALLHRKYPRKLLEGGDCSKRHTNGSQRFRAASSTITSPLVPAFLRGSVAENPVPPDPTLAVRKNDASNNFRAADRNSDSSLPLHHEQEEYAATTITNTDSCTVTDKNTDDSPDERRRLYDSIRIPLSSYDGKSTVQAERHLRQWASLLSERPQSLDRRFGAWISKVIYVSDTSRQRKSAVDGSDDSLGDDDISPTTEPRKSVEKLSKWKALLKERPSSKETGTKVSAWLSRVIEVSCSDHGPRVTSSTTSAGDNSDDDGSDEDVTADEK